jgi:hypothetical protein
LGNHLQLLKVGWVSSEKEKSQLLLKAGFCRERGIRTLDTLEGYTHFPGVLLQPLGHLSVSIFREFANRSAKEIIIPADSKPILKIQLKSSCNLSSQGLG